MDAMGDDDSSSSSSGGGADDAKDARVCFDADTTPTEEDYPRASTRTLEDALEECLTIEMRAFDDGFDEGVVDGRTLGVEEGKELGFRKGFELAEEVGYYAGCVAVWKECAARDGGFGERADRLIANFDRALEESALGNPLDEGILDRVESLRGKFKTLVALLGMRAEYSPADSALGFSF